MRPYCIIYDNVNISIQATILILVCPACDNKLHAYIGAIIQIAKYLLYMHVRVIDTFDKYFSP